MNIKTKLSLGFGLLFLMILLLASFGTFYLHQLSRDSKEIIKDNYESLVYSQGMIASLDIYDQDSSKSIKAFEKYLTEQEANITEPGEQAATALIRIEFITQLKTNINKNEFPRLRKAILNVMDVNLNAIIRKNIQAQKTANNAILYMGIIGCISVLIAFSFIVNFPGYIANPIKELTQGINQISKKDYAQRLMFRSDDEFGELAMAFNTMAAKLDEFEHSNLAKIVFEKKRIEAIVNSIQDPTIGLDEQNIILFANLQAQHILGISSEELIGKYAPDIALRNDLMRTLLNTENFKLPLKIFSEGKESYFKGERIQIFSKITLIGTLISLKNITEFKELDTAKTNFIATISHELKTPISSIKMSLKLLEDPRIGSVNEEQQKLIVNIKEDSQRLLNITGELLDLTQVETGNIQLHYQPTAPTEVVEYAYQATIFSATQKNLTIQKNISDPLPSLNIDLEKTAWVMVNLLSNAIRYSPENTEILIEVKVVGDQVVFAVQDHGKGIPLQYRERIFERFFKIPNDAQGKQGTGLGLAISKEFISAQGGKIWVEEVADGGSKFVFQLPGIVCS